MAGSQFSAELLISTSKANKELQALNGQIGAVDKSLSGLSKTLQSTQGNLDAAVKSISTLVRASREASQASNESAKAKLSEARAQAELAKVENSTNIAQARVARERANVAVAQSTVAYRNARTEAVEFANSQRAVRTSTDQLGNSLSNQRYLLYDVGATYRTLGIAASALPVAAIAAATAYEKSFAQVIRVTGETSVATAELRSDLKQLATDIPLSFAELSNIAQIGGQMNIPTEQLADFTEVVAKFVATADGATIDSSTQAFGRLANLFNEGDNFDPEFFNRIGSAISKTADTAVTSEAAIISMLDKIAPLGAQAGMSAEEIIAFGSALSSVKIGPELASGFMTRFFGQLNKDIAAGGEALDAYNAVLGTTSDETLKLAQSDPAELWRRLVEQLSKMDKISQTLALNELGIKASRDQRVIQAMANSYGVLETAITNTDEAYAKASYLDSSSQGIFSTMAATLQKLANSFMNLGDAVGSGVLPVLTSLVEGLQWAVDGITELAEANPAVKTVLATLMSLGSVLGIFFALKSASAFFTAGMVSLTHITRQSVGGTLSFTAQVRNLAAAQLQAKGMTEQASAAYVRQVGALRALGAASAISTVQARALNVAMINGQTVNKSFATGLRGAGSALVGFAGGPVGIAIAALGFLGSAWLNASADAKASAQEIVRAFEASDEAGAKALGQDFSESKIGFFESNNIQLVGKTYGELADSIGLSMEKIGAAIAGGSGAMDELINKLREQAKAFESGGENLKARETEMLIGKLEQYGSQLSTSEDAARRAEEANKGLSGSAGEAGEAFNGATEEVKNWTNELKNAIDMAFGLTNAQGALNAALESLGSGVQKSGSIGTGSADARSNLADLQQALTAQATLLQQSLEAGKISAEEAGMQYNQFAQGLLNELRQMGVDTSQVTQDVGASIDNVLATFADQGGVEIPLTVNSSQAIMEADAAMVWMQDYIASNPQIVTMTMNGDDEVANRVFSLVSYISEATNMPYEAVIDAITNPAGENTENVVKYMQQAVGGNFTAYINADTSAAAQNVQSLAEYVANQMAQISATINSSGASEFGMALGFTRGLAKTFTTLPKVLGTPAQTIKTANQSAVPSFKPLNKGYEDAARKARELGNSAGGAGKKAKKANDDTAKGSKKAGKAIQEQKKDWDELEQQISGYASRVGTAFGYVTARQTGVAEAKDEYYSVLNGIKERLEAQKKQVRDLRAENKALNAERRVQLNDAAKLEKMAKYADQMGNSERAKVYRDEAKALKASASETQSKINANEKEAKAIEKGMGNLKGYTKEAIENRRELRNLRDASLKVAEAYAASGASAKTVASETKKWTDKAKDHSKQLGYSKSDVEKVTGSTKSYVSQLKKVPKTIETNLKAKNSTKAGVDAAKKSIAGVPSSKTATIKAKGSGISAVNRDLNGASKSRTSTISAKFDAATKKRFRELGIMYNLMPGAGMAIGQVFTRLSMMNRGGLVGRDGMMKFNRGGLVPGTPPANPRADNIMASLDGNSMAMIRSGEYIHSQPAVDHYGTDIMDKINRMEIPRYALGGAVGNSRSSVDNGLSVVDLSAEAIQSIARLVQREVILVADNQAIARSAKRGADVIAQQGGVI